MREFLIVKKLGRQRLIRYDTPKQTKYVFYI